MGKTSWQDRGATLTEPAFCIFACECVLCNFDDMDDGVDFFDLLDFSLRCLICIKFV